MESLQDAGHMRMVFGSKKTSPSSESGGQISQAQVLNVEVHAALPATNATKLEMVFHADPFVGDLPTTFPAVPDAKAGSFETAFALLKYAARFNREGSQFSAAPLQAAIWRKPLEPCVTEDDHIFELVDKNGNEVVLSVGAMSGNVCSGVITQNTTTPPMCKERPAKCYHA